MVDIYLRKFAATATDVLLNDPTQSAPAVVTVQQGAGARHWRELEEMREELIRQEQEDEEILIIIMAVLAEVA